MMKSLLATAAFIAGLGLAGGASADQITLGNNTAGSYDFVGNGLGSVQVTSTGITGTNHAFYKADVGTYTFGAADFPAGPLSGGNFPSNGFQSLIVAFADGDIASGPVNWTLIKDDSNRPDLIGTWTIASSAGDADFLADFAQGSVADIDIVAIVQITLKALSSGIPSLSEIGLLSSGEIIPGAVGVPEPATLVLLGVALGMLGLTRVGRI